MFGAPKESALGAFDSQSEQEVARQLFALVREEYLRGVLAHPVVAGHEADFAVQLGPESLEDRAVMILEYDGLGISRPGGLSVKRRKYARLQRSGLYVRWVTETGREHLRKACTGEYDSPSFVRRVRVCEAGHEQADVVISTERSGEVEQLISSTKCPQCDEQTNDDAPPDGNGAS